MSLPPLRDPSPSELSLLHPKPFLTHDQVVTKTKILAKKINQQLPAIDNLICVMNGAYYWANLLEQIVKPKHRLNSDISFYHGEQIKLTSQNNLSLKSFSKKNVLICENIVATGRTLDHILEQILKQKPTKVTVCSLINNPKARLAKHRHINSFLNFHLADVEVDQFLVGFGIRGLPPLPESLRELRNIYLTKSKPDIYYKYLQP